MIDGDKVFSFEDDNQMAALKEIKVKLPVSHHIKLHSLKITRNRSISEVVMNALDEYFDKLEAKGPQKAEKE
jgi:hypothetical protein